jgi:hypothetical protein
LSKLQRYKKKFEKPAFKGIWILSIENSLKWNLIHQTWERKWELNYKEKWLLYFNGGDWKWRKLERNFKGENLIPNRPRQSCNEMPKQNIREVDTEFDTVKPTGSYTLTSMSISCETGSITRTNEDYRYPLKIQLKSQPTCTTLFTRFQIKLSITIYL